MNPFDYVTAISHTKKDIIRDSDNSYLMTKDYNPFMVNRALSYFNDCILLANEMNIRYDVDNDIQFAFFINIIRPRKRFEKWAKKEKMEDVEVVKEYYGYNEQRALEALPLLSPTQMKELKKRIKKGG